MSGRYASKAPSLRSAFSKNDCVLLPGFLDLAIGRTIAKQLTRTQFIPGSYRKDGILTGADEYSEKSPMPILHFVMNSLEVIQTIESIARCRIIGPFVGRLYRMNPRSGHFLSWHDDLGRGSMVGVSLNLSSSPYEGGALQIRNRSRAGRPRKIPNKRFGDAVLFRVAEGLEHRIMPLRGSSPKIAYAGWFKSDFERSS
jgi:2-oxoglutarate-Fe(II)-dependent oxygenase superfamily protein